MLQLQYRPKGDNQTKKGESNRGKESKRTKKRQEELNQESESIERNQDESKQESMESRIQNTTRNRTTLITSVLKIVFTVLFAFGLNYFMYITETSNPGTSVYYGFKYFADDTTKLTIFLLQVRSTDCNIT